MAETLGTNDSVSAHRVSVVRTIATGGVVFVLCLILGLVSESIAVDDAYIAGYAAALQSSPRYNTPHPNEGKDKWLIHHDPRSLAVHRLLRAVANNQKLLRAPNRRPMCAPSFVYPGLARKELLLISVQAENVARPNEMRTEV